MAHHGFFFGGGENPLARASSMLQFFFFVSWLGRKKNQKRPRLFVFLCRLLNLLLYHWPDQHQFITYTPG